MSYDSEVARQTYHHGDLRRALIDATVHLIETEGMAGFSLRKVATNAGVSPAAPSHHFGDTCGLLTAVAVEGFSQLAESFAAIDPDASPAARLREHGRRYVDFAVNSPGHMAVMFRDDLITKTDPEYLAIAPQSYTSLEAATAEAIGGRPGSKRVEQASKTLWAAVHGIAQLYVLDGTTLAEDPSIGGLVDAAVDLVMQGSAQQKR